MSTGYKKCLYSDLRTQCKDKFVKKITFISIIILFLKHLYLSSRILNSLYNMVSHPIWRNKPAPSDWF